CLKSLHSLIAYHILMLSYYIRFATQRVPGCKDQTQHVEIACDLALKLHTEWPDIFTMTQAQIKEGLAPVVGIDEAKKTISYKNTINLYN
ncbi:tryptophan--tRNA ligase, partial [Campylobacter coli]